MPATVVPNAASSVEVETRQTLTISAVDPGAALMPVLIVLRRRQCRITQVRFKEGSSHTSGHLVIEVVPPPHRAHCVAAWVANVVGVCGVEVRPRSG